MCYTRSLRFCPGLASARQAITSFSLIVKFSGCEKFITANIRKTRHKTSPKFYPHIHTYGRTYIFVLYFIHKYKEALTFPFYANNPEIIRERWKTVCVAAKRSGLSAKTASFDSIGQAWKDVVRFYKRGKIKNSTDDGIGGYFYGVLCDYLLNDCLRSLA